MRNHRWLAVAFTVLAVLSLGVGCASKPKQKTIAVVTPYMANETTKHVIDVFKSLGEAKGWKVNVTDTAGDFGLLVGRIQDAVTQKVDAIVLGMGDPAQMTAGLAAAKAAGIPVFGIDAGIADGVVLNVTSDNSDLGRTSAKALAEAIGNQGKIYMFTHDPHPGVRERAAAAAEYFAGIPGIKIIDKKHIEVPGPLDNARKLTQDILTANTRKGEIAGFWAGWDEPAMGAVQAIQAAGRDEIKAVGIDGTDFARAEIAKKGSFIATVAQDFDGMAQATIDALDSWFKGEKPASDVVRIPGKLVTE